MTPSACGSVTAVASVVVQQLHEGEPSLPHLAAVLLKSDERDGTITVGAASDEARPTRSAASCT